MGDISTTARVGLAEKYPQKIKRSISRKRLTIKHLICIIKPR
uniref:Uncharacterized protein n=1 Tax=Siphoviridae sp. ctvxh7 TaxID=2827283 RepID=A0A8S5R9Z9_9CAUD|nr:MAG TPA: hypothetical protein [Siphoviridae sp. ctvxh7]